jgi:IS5 family transposase
VRRQWEWSGCWGFTFCSNGSTCQTLDVEEALYDSGVMRQFVGIDLGCEPAPDETTVCKFLHLLEAHQLGEQMLGEVNLRPQAKGVRITSRTMVDATILHAPTSTKNREQQRDPEMHQTKKGKQ